MVRSAKRPEARPSPAGGRTSRWPRLALAAAVLAGAAWAYWKLAVPTHRVDVRSELVMLGDLDDDRRWSDRDLAALEAFLAAPFAESGETAWRLDLNQNRLLDEEDLRILRGVVAAGGDPYAAEEAARARREPFPRPRELYRYVATTEYRPRPLWALAAPLPDDSVVGWLREAHPAAGAGSYGATLEAAILDEAVRLDRAYRRRAPGLLPIERRYAETKLGRARALHEADERFELLLALIELSEDAETLTARGQPDRVLDLLALRDHLREVLASELLAEIEASRRDGRAILPVVTGHLRADLGLTLDLETLGPARDLSSLENYLQRGEWQYYKTSAREEDFRALIAFAQQDPRYLRAVSRTSRRRQDPAVENHNLPMVLLFREALRITKGDKRRAVGLLDEAIRIPYAWIALIPREALPGSVALENFLLPGNMEDGADKSRHWNVFGGICLYKSPEEALELALRRELQDLRKAGFTADATREFLRDMIANLNGMYHVMSVDPGLSARPPPG